MQTEQFHLHDQLEETHWWFTGRREIIRRLVHSVLPPSPSAVLLDIGCGTGGNLAAFAGDYRCFGWDPSAEAVRLAQQRVPSVQFLGGPLAKTFAALPAAPDFLLILDVLEHVEKDQALFSQLVAALRPGGHILLTVPAGMELWSPHDVSFGHFRRYSRPELEQLWLDQPVMPRMVSYYNSRLYPVARCVRFWTRRTGRAWGEAGTDLRIPSAPVNRLLTRLLSAEANVLVSCLKKERQAGFSCGVSLIALLQKEGKTADGS